MTCIIFGGVSPEHEISIISAYQVKEYFDDVNLIYFSKDYNFYLANNMTLDDFKAGRKKIKKIWFCKKGFKTRFKYYEITSAICLIHGVNGEDGSLKGLLNLYNIPSVGCSIYNSALFMDKYLSHMALKNKGYLVADSYLLKKKDFIFKDYDNKYPCIIKPNNGGSSIGVYVCKNETEFIVSASELFKSNDDIIVEAYLENSEEYNVAVSSAYVSDVYRIETKGEIFSFDDKYDGELKLKNRRIDTSLANELKIIATNIYKDFDLQGIVRVDFLVNDEDVYICELNTAPGALSSYMFEDFENVIESEIQKSLYFEHKKQIFIENIDFNLFNVKKFNK